MKSIEWHDAMAREIQALESNNTWSLCSLPKGKSPIGCKWVYQIKYHYNGSVERYNAQVEAIDYHDSSPVAKLVTVHHLLSIVAIKNWPLYQFDANNAFLQGNL